MRRRTLLLSGLLVLRALPCGAHAVGVSRGEYRAEDAEVRAQLVFARKELLLALPNLDVDGDGDLSSGELEHGRTGLSEWVRRGVAVRVPENACAGELQGASLSEQDGVELSAVYECPRPATAFALRLALLAELSVGHRHLASATSPSGTVRAVLYEAQPALDLAPSSAGTVAPSLLRLGVEHILTGYDHLLFLLALVLIGGSLRSVLGVVTAFTLGHSVTLAVAALGLWVPRPAFVEPAIALSIAYVGVENCVRPDLRRRWRLTFLFGLVHGFGFAGALREVALSAAQLPLALASFNVGVEAGQLAVLAAVLPVVSWLGGRAWFAGRGVRLASIAISAAGLCWFVVRVTG